MPTSGCGPASVRAPTPHRPAARRAAPPAPEIGAGVMALVLVRAGCMAMVKSSMLYAEREQETLGRNRRQDSLLRQRACIEQTKGTRTSLVLVATTTDCQPANLRLSGMRPANTQEHRQRPSLRPEPGGGSAVPARTRTRCVRLPYLRERLALARHLGEERRTV